MTALLLTDRDRLLAAAEVLADRRLRLVRLTADRAEAEVTSDLGAAPYRVRVHLDGSGAHCSCPADWAERRLGCRHVRALRLALAVLAPSGATP